MQHLTSILSLLIQVIVKAAVHHLDMVGLKDELSVQSSQESTCVG